MKRKLLMLVALLACLAIFPSVAQAAESDTIEVGDVTLSSTSPYAKTDSEGTVTAATEEDHNISWDAETATLTLDNADFSVEDNRAIAADVETLTIVLEGENKIKVSTEAPIQDQHDDTNENFAAIENKVGNIVIKNADSDTAGSLTLEVTVTDESDFVGCNVAGIRSAENFENQSNVAIKMGTNDDDVEYRVTGIYAGNDWNGEDAQSGSFVNSGNLDITVSTTYQRAYGIISLVNEFTNSGNISLNVDRGNKQSYSACYGIALFGNYEKNAALKKEVNNTGTIEIVLDSDASQGLDGIYVVNQWGELSVINGPEASLNIMTEEEAVASSANGIYLDSNKQIDVKNEGRLTINIKATSGVNGVYMISFNENADLTNSGTMDIDVQTQETGSAYGIWMLLNYITGESPQHTNLTFEQGSDVEIDTGSTGDRMAILQQRCYVTVAAEGEEGQDQIFFNDTVIDGGGTVYTEYQNVSSQHYYISSLIDNNDEILTSLHISTAVQATDIVLNSGALSLMVDDTATLSATVSPADVTDPTVTWTSSDESVATVDENGKVTAIAPGTATITATTANGLKATCEVMVEAPEPPYTGKYSYEIFTDIGDNGTLSVDRYATEGDKVTIDVSPDEAYLLEDLTITSGGKEVEVTDNGDGTYSFTMPSGDVEISATFAEDPDWTEPEPEPEPSTDVSEIFLDVAPNAWYKDAVQYAYDNGLMTGVSAMEFAPDQTTTRAMIVSILARLENVTSASDAGFSDVDDEWFATAVNWAASENIVAGFEDNTFRPNNAITREQLAAILMNYAAYKGEDVSARADLSAYSDADAVSSWAAETMRWAVAEGYISGMTADELQPQGNATRAQLAAILERFCAE